MNPIFRAAAEVQQFYDTQGWQFCIIGGIAFFSLPWLARQTTKNGVSTLGHVGT